MANPLWLQFGTV